MLHVYCRNGIFATPILRFFSNKLICFKIMITTFVFIMVHLMNEISSLNYIFYETKYLSHEKIIYRINFISRTINTFLQEFN